MTSLTKPTKSPPLSLPGRVFEERQLTGDEILRWSLQIIHCHNVVFRQELNDLEIWFRSDAFRAAYTMTVVLQDVWCALQGKYKKAGEGGVLPSADQIALLQLQVNFVFLVEMQEDAIGGRFTRDVFVPGEGWDDRLSI